MSRDHPVWHDCVEEVLEDVVALVEGEDVVEVAWRQLYTIRSSRKIHSPILFSRE